MATLLNTRHEPGDIVRDRKTGLDYVVQSVASAAIGAGVVLYGFELWTRKMREFEADNEADLDLLSVRRNVEKLSPENAGRLIRDKVSRPVGRRQDLITELVKPEHRVFRDLLMLSDEVDEAKFSSAIVEVADTLIQTTESIPSPDQIYRIFRSNIDPEVIGDEFIWEFSKDLSRTAENRAGLKNRAYSFWADEMTDRAKEIFFSSSHTPQVPVTKGAALPELARLTQRQGSYTPISGNFDREFNRFLTGRRLANPLVFSRSPILSQASRLNGSDRVAFLLREAMRAGGARITPEVESVISYAARYTRAPKNTLSPLAQMLLKSGLNGELEIAKRAHARLGRGIGAPKYLQKVRPNYNVAAIRPFRHLRPGVDLEEAAGLKPLGRTGRTLPDSSGRLGRLLSIDTPTLLESLRGANIVLDGQEANMSQAGVAALVRERLEGRDPFLLIEPKRLREVVTAAKTGERVSIDEMVARSGVIRANLKRAGLAGLYELHRDGAPARGQFLGRPASRIAHSFVPTSLLVQSATPADTYRAAIAGGEHAFLAAERALGVAAPKVGMSRVYLGMTEQGIPLGSTSPSALETQLTSPDPNASLRYVDVPTDTLPDYGLETGDASDMVDELWDTGQELSRNMELPPTSEGIAQRVASIKASVAEPYDAAFHEVDEISAAFEEGYRSHSAGLGLLRTPGGDRVVVAGTPLDVPFEEQVQRAFRLLDGDGGLLDIETARSGGSTVVKDINLAVNEGGALREIFQWDKSYSERENIQLLAQALPEVPAIGTMTPYDWISLSERSGQLGLLEEQRAFREASVAKGFDLRAFFQQAGVDAGDASQQAMMLRARRANLSIPFQDPEGIELHTGRADNLDVFELLKHHRDAAETNQLTLLDKEGILRNNLVLYGEDTRGSLPTGSMHRLVDLQVNAEGRVDALYQQLRPMDGQLISGGLLSESYASPDVAGKVINLQSVRVSNDNLQALTEAYYREADDLSTRTLRSLQPYAKSIADPFVGQPGLAWSPEEGAFGASLIQVERKAGEILRGMRASGQVDEFRNIPGTVEAMAERDARIQAVASAQAAQVRGDEKLQARLAHRIGQALADPREEYMLTQSKSAQAIASSLGESLSALAADREYGAGVLYSIGYERMLKKAVDLNAVSVLETTPRLSMKLAGATASARLSTNAKNIESTMQSLAAKIVLGVGGAGDVNREDAFDILQEALKDTDMDFEGIKDRASRYLDLQEARGRGNYQNYRKAIEEVGFLDPKDAEFGDLSRAVARVRDSAAMRQSLVSAIRDKASSQFDDVAGEANRQRLLHLADRVESGLSKSRRTSQATRAQAGLEAAFNEDPNLLSAFKDRYEVLDLEGLSQKLGHDGARELEAETRQIVSEIADRAGDDAPLRLADRVAAVRDAAWETASAESRRLSLTEQSRGGRYIERAHRMLMSFQTPSVRAGASVRTLHELRLSQASSPSTGAAIVKAAHRINMETVSARGAAMKSKYTAPLLAIGGALALMSAHTPAVGKRPGETVPNSATPFNAAVAFGSDQPGSADPDRMWVGQEEPFRLDISFRGFVAHKREQEDLVRKVHNSISGRVEVQRVNSQVQDERNATHRAAARDAIREGFR